jgi:hypothetical protein
MVLRKNEMKFKKNFFYSILWPQRYLTGRERDSQNNTNEEMVENNVSTP